MKIKKKKQKKNVSVKNDSEHGELPTHNTCRMCGVAKAARPDIILKRIQQYGSLEKLLAEYECRDCRKKPGAKAPSIKREPKLGQGDWIDEEGKVCYFWQKPGWVGFSNPSPINLLASREEYIRAAGTTCYRPDIYLNNGKFCDGCPFYNTCACPLRRLRGEAVKIDEETGEEKPLTYYMKKKLGIIKPKTRVATDGSAPKMRKKLGLLKWTHKK